MSGSCSRVVERRWIPLTTEHNTSQLAELEQEDQKVPGEVVLACPSISVQDFHQVLRSGHEVVIWSTSRSWKWKTVQLAGHSLLESFSQVTLDIFGYCNETKVITVIFEVKTKRVLGSLGGGCAWCRIKRSNSVQLEWKVRWPYDIYDIF